MGALNPRPFTWPETGMMYGLRMLIKKWQTAPGCLQDNMETEMADWTRVLAGQHGKGAVHLQDQGAHLL